MKKALFILLLLPAIAFSQTGDPTNIDTAKVRNFTLRAQDWAYAIAFAQISVTDTATMDFISHLQSKIRAASNATWNTNITVDSMPLRAAQGMYNIYYSSRVSNITLLGSNIGDQLQAIAHPLFVAWRTARNQELTQQFTDLREAGRRFLIGK